MTTYAWDWASGLPEMLSDGASLYLVGHDTLGRFADGEWAYHLPDALGSVRQVVDGAGSLASSREWTPFGVEVGAAQAGLGYTGEWGDPSVGLTYLRARWLAPQVGRFTQKDLAPGYVQIPHSLHVYVYAWSNPINLTDPTGLQVQPPDNCEPGEICYTGTTGPYMPLSPLPPIVYSLPCMPFSPSSIDALVWRYEVLDNLQGAGPVCQHAEQYIVNNNVQFVFASSSTWAAWTLDRNIKLDTPRYSLNTSPADVFMLSLIVHEAWHLEQGPLLALSVLGELGAWQIQHDALVELGEPYPKKILKNADLIRMLPSPLDGPVSIDVLMLAQGLMLDSQGWGYLIWLLPLRPGGV